MQELDSSCEFSFEECPKLFSKQVRKRALFSSALSGAPAQHKDVALPIAVFEGGRKKRFVWDGKKIVRRGHDGQGDRPTRLQSLLTAVQDAKHNLLRSFFPKKSEVTDDYWAFVSWRAGHRLSSAMLGNFATQSLLAAVGVGAKHQLPAAASINWLLKDGLGRLGRLCVAACLGHKFDSELKRYRWVTSLAFTGATALEFMAPLMPQHFLFLASIANVGKAVGITTYVATHPAFMRSFARGDNLADINAKGQAQQMVMDTLGLALCVALTYGVRHSQKGRIMLPLVMFPFLAAVDLLCIFKELKATHLRSLNQERTEILAEEWLASGAVLSPQQVSAKEQLMFPRRGSSAHAMPVSFVTVDQIAQHPTELVQLLENYRQQTYLLTVSNRKSWNTLGIGKHTDCIAIALQEGALSQDVIAALLQAEIVRIVEGRKTYPDRSQRSCKTKLMAAAKEFPENPIVASSDLQNITLPELQQHSLRLAEHLVSPFCKELRAGAWQTDGFLIPPSQKDGFISLM